jgi:uncharacterized lipoprotein NlpE involved in copper resistance
MKKSIFITAIICLLLSCNSKKKEEITAPEIKKTKTDKRLHKLALYEGVLPCADCSGIQTTLKIDTDYGVMQNNKFELISVYLGKEPNNTFTEIGSFNTERGLGDDPDGTIYVLNYDQPQEKQIYYGYFSANPEKMYLLDKDRKMIKSKLNYFLMLKK